jgi:fluoroacetyl-CoA thioesterase
MREYIIPGIRHSQSLIVDQRLTVPAVSQRFTGFADMPLVFATAYLIGFVEWTCVEALRPFLQPGEQTVGTHVDMSHIAATPVGMAVTAEVEVVAVQGRKLRFKVLCRDEKDVISKGFHERAVIDRAKFIERLTAKAA